MAVRYVLARQFHTMKLYAYAHHYGFFDWGALCQAVKFDRKFEAVALKSAMSLGADDAVFVEEVEDGAS